MLKPGRDRENKKKKGVVPSSSSASELEGEEGRRNKKRKAGPPAKFSVSGEVPAKRRRGGKKQTKGASDYDENRDERPPPEITQLGKFRQVCVSSRRHAVRRKP